MNGLTVQKSLLRWKPPLIARDSCMSETTLSQASKRNSVATNFNCPRATPPANIFRPEPSLLFSTLQHPPLNSPLWENASDSAHQINLCNTTLFRSGNLELLLKKEQGRPDVRPPLFVYGRVTGIKAIPDYGNKRRASSATSSKSAWVVVCVAKVAASAPSGP